MGNSFKTPAASVAFCQSSWLIKPVLSLFESMRASEVSSLMESCSLDISKEKTATGLRSLRATFLAIFNAKAVFPMLGLAARIIKSDFCNPDVIWFNLGYPEDIPESPPSFPC